MSHISADFLTPLLSAESDVARARWWDAFIDEYTPLIMHVAKSIGGDHDAVMDRYVFVVDALRDHEYKRLRSYNPEEGARFSSWLLVVARRLCMDQYRARYGRVQSDTHAAESNHRARRALSDLVSDELALESVEDVQTGDPDFVLRQSDLTQRLESALASLPTADRLLLRFRFEDDLSVPRIAQLIDAESPFVVYRRLDKILRILRKSLEDSGVSESLP